MSRSRFMKKVPLVGYQGWFRAEGDGSGEGWSHYSERGPLTAATLHPDFWPDVTEYEKTYPTSLTNRDGSTARVFSSWNQSTTDLHFRWMQQYGIDGVFVQRFFAGLRSPERRRKSRVVLENCLRSSRQYGQAFAVMYDLSGLRDAGEDCSAIIQDWKQLVDELKVTSQPTNHYLYHRGKPLVTIWGLGFPDRGYNIRNIGIDKVIRFLKSDPEYGGCSVMLGVPAYFRDLNVDTNPDPYLHQLMESADVIMAWMVQRLNPVSSRQPEQQRSQGNNKRDFRLPRRRSGRSISLHTADATRRLGEVGHHVPTRDQDTPEMFRRPGIWTSIGERGHPPDAAVVISSRPA